MYQVKIVVRDKTSLLRNKQPFLGTQSLIGRPIRKKTIKDFPGFSSELHRFIAPILF